MDWQNWSGSLRAGPCALSEPQTADELCMLLKAGNGPVRVRGAGHSFMPLVPTNGTMVSLDRLPDRVNRIVGQDVAWVSAGSRLHRLSELLEAEGLAFRNLGDINVQSLAGAAATATHGTGETLPCLGAEITGVRMVTASGEQIEATSERDSDVLAAAQVSLGALGVLTEARISLAPRYRLERQTWPERFSDILSEAESRWAKHRNYEFFYVPHSGHGINIVHDLTSHPPTPRKPGTDEAGLAKLKLARDLLKHAPRLRRAVLGLAVRNEHAERAVGDSWRLLSSVRETRFEEMEYHLPPNTALKTLDTLVMRMERAHPDVYFPIEVRKTAGDAAWLSPFSGGSRVSVAIHALAGEKIDWFHTLAEPLFRAAGGRPHWGKRHSLTHVDLRALYPDFTAFLDLRRRLDPRNRLLNSHLGDLFGEKIDG